MEFPKPSGDKDAQAQAHDRLAAARDGQDQVKDRLGAARGTANEHQVSQEARAARMELEAREAWLGWVHEDR